MSSIVPKSSQFAKEGINVTYTDGSAQNLSFANKTLTVDRGLVVNTSKATLNQGLDVNNVVANLNNGLVVSGAKSTLNQGLEVSEKATLNNDLEVKGNSLFSKDVKINAANLDVNGTVSVSKLLTASNGATISGGALLAQMGANVSGGMFNAQAGADVKGGLSVSTGSFTAQTGATISGGALLAQMGANVSGGMFNAQAGADVKGGLTVSTGDFKALNGATVSNALFSAEKGAAVSGGLLTANKGATISGELLDAQMGLNVSGAALNALQGANVRNGLHVETGMFTASNGAIVSGGALLAQMGATVSGGAFNAENSAVVKGGLTVATGALLAYNGATVSNALFSAEKGATVSGGAFNALSGASISGGLLVAANGANVSGAFNALDGATVRNGLTVETGLLTASNGLTVNNNELLANKGATVSGGAFNAENSAVVKGGLTVATGDFKAFNGATVSNALFSAEKGATVSGGLLTASNGATVNGNALLANAGATVSGGLFSAQAGATISGGLLVAANGANVSGAFNALNGATVNSGLTVNQTATMNNDLLVKANATISNGLVVNGALTQLTAGLQVSGQTMSNSLVVSESALVKGDLEIKGNLTVLGTQTFVHTQNLEIKDNVMLLADGNISDVVETGFMLQYKPAGATAPKYSGMKRLPVSGELVFFKDANNQIGNDDIGNSQAIAERDTAQADFNVKKAVTDAAGDAYTTATQVHAAAVQVTADKNALIQPHSAYPGYDGKPDALGEYVIVNFDVPTVLTGFNVGVDQTKNSLSKTTFLGSNDNVVFNYIADTTFQREIKVDGVITRNGVNSISWPSVTYKYLKIVYEKLEISISGSPHFCINNAGGTLSGVPVNKLTLSSGLITSGFMMDNGVAITSELPDSVILVSFLSGKYDNTLSAGDILVIGNYNGQVQSAMIYLTANYSLWLTANGNAISVRDAAVLDQASKLTAKTDALALWNAKGAISSAAFAVLAIKISELGRLVPDTYATVVADSFNCHSDARLKKDIVELNGALDKLDAIRGVSYNWIAESMPEHQVGVIAQEIQSVYPELVKEGGNGFLSVDYPKLTAVLIQALKELKALVLSK